MYILASARDVRPVIYVGVTNDIVRRLAEHRRHRQGFVGHYRVTILVHVEHTSNARAATAREKQLKGWTRAKKIAIVEIANPEWRDLLPERE